MNKAVVVFSGGQDSTTCLGWALNRFELVECITFNYGQKHSIELTQAAAICAKLEIKHIVVDISFLNTLVDSALTSDGNVNEAHPRLKHLPASFVPNRNALFLTLAHAYAQKIGANTVVTGVCETDFSGYPDCREVFIKSLQESLHLASDVLIKIETPLMFIDKAGTFKMAKDEGVLDLVIEMSHTCYNGIREMHEWGAGCGECPACKLRQKGYQDYLETL